MKKTVLLITSLVFITSLSFSQSKMDINHLIDRDGQLYAPDNDQPYTGIVFEFHKSGQKKREETFKDGELNGLSTIYHENGQKKSEGNHKDGEREGLWTWWYGNGQKFYEDIYKDGELIESKKWDRDGNLIED